MNRLISCIVALTFSVILSTNLTFAVPTHGPPPYKGEETPSTDKDELIDINTASEDQLKVLPGIDEAYSKKIIAGRPYKNKTELKTKGVIPDYVYQKIKGKVVVKEPKK